MSLIPGWGTKIPHVVQYGPKVKKKKKKEKKERNCYITFFFIFPIIHSFRCEKVLFISTSLLPLLFSFQSRIQLLQPHGR